MRGGCWVRRGRSRLRPYREPMSRLESGKSRVRAGRSPPARGSAPAAVARHLRRRRHLIRPSAIAIAASTTAATGTRYAARSKPSLAGCGKHVLAELRHQRVLDLLLGPALLDLSADEEPLPLGLGREGVAEDRPQVGHITSSSMSGSEARGARGHAGRSGGEQRTR